ncbi:unnamed protein product [Ambrosiozyma monospora]|uniref:Autophagy protein 5 n=1 Tax=Ambrosiozyma monospora TaxID=43982 RepID=A0A9W6YVK0_AMBMO|nr:unnamed protein product [Ambrosiozyma monospora]
MSSFNYSPSPSPSPIPSVGGGSNDGAGNGNSSFTSTSQEIISRVWKGTIPAVFSLDPNLFQLLQSSSNQNPISNEVPSSSSSNNQNASGTETGTGTTPLGGNDNGTGLKSKGDNASSTTVPISTSKSNMMKGSSSGANHSLNPNLRPKQKNDADQIENAIKQFQQVKFHTVLIRNRYIHYELATVLKFFKPILKQLAEIMHIRDEYNKSNSNVNDLVTLVSSSPASGSGTGVDGKKVGYIRSKGASKSKRDKSKHQGDYGDDDARDVMLKLNLDQIWFEVDDVPLKWNLPIGSLYDMTTIGIENDDLKQRDSVWHVVVKFGSFGSVGVDAGLAKYPYDYVIPVELNEHLMKVLSKRTADESRLGGGLGRLGSPRSRDGTPSSSGSGSIRRKSSSSGVKGSSSDNEDVVDIEEVDLFVDDTLISETVDSFLKSYWMNQLKEVCFIINGSSNKFLSFANLETQHFYKSATSPILVPTLTEKSPYLQFNNYFKRITPTRPSEIRNIPIKIYLPLLNRVLQPSSTTLSRLCPTSPSISTSSSTGGWSHITLGQLLQTMIPDLFPSNLMYTVAYPVSHGVILPLSAPVVELFALMRFFDGFLHVSVKMIGKNSSGSGGISGISLFGMI